MPARSREPVRPVLKIALLLIPLVAMAACRCEEAVQARAFVGHLTEAECARKITEPEAPVSIICPGSEVSLCWGSNVDQTTITIDPDSEGQSGQYGRQGVLYLKPGQDTTVEVRASDCAATRKKILVLNEPRSATFDARWDGECEKLSYTLNPAFVDEDVQTTDVTAMWSPMADSPDGTAPLCPAMQFLDGAHPIEAYFFSIQSPFTLTPFSLPPHPAIDDWVYTLDKDCMDGYKCNPDAAQPFAMTLQCPTSP